MSETAYQDYELDFIQEQALPHAYLDQARSCYLPFAHYLVTTCQQRETPYFLGINGSQGSGKSTLSLYLKAVLEQSGLKVLVLSLDDFYLPRSAREQLSKTTHPLLKTRGVPGTHDIPLMQQCLEALKTNAPVVECPRFNKATDDRYAQLETLEQGCDLLIFEGWCWGSRHQSVTALEAPINRLEREEDPDGTWRHFVNHCLQKDYEPLYEYFDCWAMLKAPSFENVYQWRLEQEQKLAARIEEDEGSQIMSPAAIERFIAHYQRITEETLTALPEHCDVLWLLDARRRVTETKSQLPLGSTESTPG